MLSPTRREIQPLGPVWCLSRANRLRPLPRHAPHRAERKVLAKSRRPAICSARLSDSRLFPVAGASGEARRGRDCCTSHRPRICAAPPIPHCVPVAPAFPLRPGRCPVLAVRKLAVREYGVSPGDGQMVRMKSEAIPRCQIPNYMLARIPGSRPMSGWRTCSRPGLLPLPHRWKRTEADPEIRARS